MLNNVAIGGKTAALSYKHWVAKSYPFLAVKEKNTNTGNERLDLKVRKIDGNHVVVLNKINANPGEFKYVNGTAGAFEDVALSTDDVVARSKVA